MHEWTKEGKLNECGREEQRRLELLRKWGELCWKILLEQGIRCLLNTYALRWFGSYVAEYTVISGASSNGTARASFSSKTPSVDIMGW